MITKTERRINYSRCTITLPTSPSASARYYCAIPFILRYFLILVKRKSKKCDTNSLIISQIPIEINASVPTKYLRCAQQSNFFRYAQKITLGSFTCRRGRHFALQKRETFRVFASKSRRFDGETNGSAPFARSATSLMRSITSFAEGNFICTNGATSFICVHLAAE